MSGLPEAEIGVFGGSGFYEFLDDVTEVTVQTPFGSPSAKVRVGDIGGRRVAFLARHGVAHEVPAHRVNYRANLWALRKNREHPHVQSLLTSWGERVFKGASGELMPEGKRTVLIPDHADAEASLEARVVNLCGLLQKPGFGLARHDGDDLGNLAFGR